MLDDAVLSHDQERAAEQPRAWQLLSAVPLWPSRVQHDRMEDADPVSLIQLPVAGLVLRSESVPGAC
jgi:hypothetical protein